MFGKHFGSMYEGSLVGSGAVVFAVMGYVIAKQIPDRVMGSQVRLNPVLLAAILGESQDDIESAIEKLCSPDERSTTKAKEGRRLVKIGEFDYQVVNGAKYRAIRDQESRMEQNRLAQQRHRAKKSGAAPGEATALAAESNGDLDTYDRIAATPKKEMIGTVGVREKLAAMRKKSQSG